VGNPYREEEWQTATGLMRGGCPGGVSPADLEQFIHAVSRLVSAAREVVNEHPVQRRLSIGMTKLLSPLYDLDERWPEE
jgi:hypothetical protein